ncbi:MAG: hypothetical protein Q4D88_03910 [Anaerococcus sp.]|nr:hypothetical protein [Anaerococcus sp.]
MKKIYTTSLILGLISIILGLIFRYSYINILGIDRPLKLISYICFILGVIGSILALIDGVNKDFKRPILGLLILNTLLIFTYPILLGTETFLKSPINPFVDRAPDYGNTTTNRSDSAFIIEGKLYTFPLNLEDFLENNFTYDLVEKEEKTYASISRSGESEKLQPTWFTDGENKNAYKEFYLLEAYFEDNDPKNQITKIKASLINNNRDFEVRGIRLEDSILALEKEFANDLKEDPENINTPIKKYYLKTSDGYQITLSSLNRKIQTIEIEKNK